MSNIDGQEKNLQDGRAITHPRFAGSEASLERFFSDTDNGNNMLFRRSEKFFPIAHILCGLSRRRL